MKKFWSKLISNSRCSSFRIVFCTFWPDSLTLDLFLTGTPKGWKKSTGFLDAEFYAESFEKKKKKSLDTRSSPDPENSRGGHQQSYTFFLVFTNLRTLPGNWSIRSRKINSKRVNFFWLSQKETFLEPIENNPFFVSITVEPVSATISRALFWWSQRFTYFFFFILLQLLIMRSQPASVAWTVTSAAAFYHCWSYTEHSVLWIRCVVYIWY